MISGSLIELAFANTEVEAEPSFTGALVEVLAGALVAGALTELSLTVGV